MWISVVLHWNPCILQSLQLYRELQKSAQSGMSWQKAGLGWHSQYFCPGLKNEPTKVRESSVGIWTVRCFRWTKCRLRFNIQAFQRFLKHLLGHTAPPIEKGPHSSQTSLPACDMVSLQICLLLCFYFGDVSAWPRLFWDGLWGQQWKRKKVGRMLPRIAFVQQQ